MNRDELVRRGFVCDSVGFMGDEREIVCVLGMHRSGTSLLARVLNLLGVELGPQTKLTTEPREANPKGYWENHDLTSISDALIKRFGGTWDEPPIFPAGWHDDTAVADLRARAQLLIEEQFAASTLWGWKDPRTCLTLPFWQSQLSGLKYILCLRNPLEVAASLERRDGFSIEKSCALWLIYVLSALDHTDDDSRLMLFYEDLMSDSSNTLDRIAKFLGRTVDAETRKSIEQFVDPTLYHHQLTKISEAENDALALYHALREGNAYTTKQPVDVVARLTQQITNQARALYQREQRLDHLEEQLAQLSQKPWNWLKRK